MQIESLGVGQLGAAFVLSFAVCAAIIWFLLRTRLAFRIALDRPNSRSLHRAPIPRAGGWGLIPAAVAGAVISGGWDVLLLCLVSVVFLVSYADDRVSLPILVRMPIHSAAAALWLSYGPIELAPVVAVLAGCGIVWIMNLFNFMDGADGLAGGMALFAFGTFAAVAGASGMAAPLAIWSMAVAGAAAGFLLFNFHPARVFLGDAGSVALGFLAGVFGVWGWAAGIWPFWFPFLVSAPFFLDGSVTLLGRMARREAFWRAHCDHYYQRLIRSGWSHRRTAICEYAVMAASAALAIAMLPWPAKAQYGGLAIAALIYAVLMIAIDIRWARFQRRLRTADTAPTTGAGALRLSEATLPRESRG